MIAGIVLAAGSSTRLGRPKQLLPLHGEPLIRHTLRRVLQSSLDEVIVVVGHDAEAVSAAIADLPVEIIVNPDSALGQSTSVVAGIEALRDITHSSAESSLGYEAALILLGDQPGVDPQVIDALIASWMNSHAPIVAPRYRDTLGNPILFDRRVFPELQALGGDVGARAIVRKYQSAGDLVLVPIDTAAPPDVDTEEDYAVLLSSYVADAAACTQHPSPSELGKGQG